MSLLRLKFLRKCLTNSGSTRHIFYARDVSTQPASGAKSWRWVAFTTKMGSFNQCAHHCGCPLFSSPRSMASTTWTSSRSWSTMPRYERPEMLLYNVGSLQAIYPLVNWYGNRIMECGPFLDAFPSWKFGFSIAMFVSRQCIWSVQVGVPYSQTLDWFATQRSKKQVIHDFNFWSI